jgi:lysophospholipase L1-like esterase
VIVTDGASTTSTSVQTADQTALLTRVVLAPIVVGFIGDSITANMGSAGSFISLLAAQEPTRSVSYGSNQGVAGTTSTDWLPGGSYLPGALSAFATAGVTHVTIMLGTNDAKTATATSSSTYASNIASIAAACVSAGYKVVLNGPLAIVPGSYGQWDEAANVRLASYRDSLAALTNGTTIYLGDTQLFDAISAAPGTYLSDGIHPNGTGNTLIWNRWAAN